MKPFKRLTKMSAVTVFSAAILLLGGCGMPTKSQGVEQENRKGPGLVQRSMVQSQQAPTSVQVQTPSATSENAHQNIIAYKEVMQAVTDYLRHNGKDETCVAFQPDLTLPVFPRVMFGEVTLSKGEKKHVLLDRIQGVWTVEQLLPPRLSVRDVPRGVLDAYGAQKVQGTIEQIEQEQGQLRSMDVRVSKNLVDNLHMETLQSGHLVHLTFDMQTSFKNTSQLKAGNEVVVYAFPFDPRVTGGDQGWYAPVDGLFYGKSGSDALFDFVTGESVQNTELRHAKVSLAAGVQSNSTIEAIQNELVHRIMRSQASVTITRFEEVSHDNGRITGILSMQIQKGPIISSDYWAEGLLQKVVTLETVDGKPKVTDIEGYSAVQ